MIENIDHLPDNLELEADVCIVGSGAAGLMMALELMAAGIQVIMLEAGDFRPTEKIQSLYSGEVIDEAFRGLIEGRSRQFGGTTRLWGGQCVRLDKSDFEARPWVPHSGWPIPYDDLEPFYQRAQARLGVTAQPFAPDVWQRFGLEPFHFDPGELVSSHGVFIRHPKLGNRYRAKLAAASNIRVVLGANVTGIATSPYGKAVSGVDFRGLNGKSGKVIASRVVLCAGGIENARLLLLSDKTVPCGLGNDRDLVGRFLNDHPCGITATIATDNPRRLQDHFNMLYSRAAFYLPKMSLSEAAQKREQALNCVGRLTYDFGAGSGMKALRDIVVDIHSRRWPPEFATKLTRVARAVPQFAPAAWRLARHGLSPAPRPSRILLETFTEQTPNPDSRVTLSRGVDPLGLRRVKVDWRLDALTGHTLRVFTDSVSREFSRLGLGTLTKSDWLNDVVPRYPDVLDSYHHTGTTRMADSPARGVVDTDCQVFGVNGLYIAGSSVFPTAGAANPTFSIAALAIRLSDYIKQDVRTAAVPPRSRSMRETAVAEAAA